MFNPRQPLGLPAGSVRAILAFIVVTPIALIALRSNIQLTGDQFVGLASMVLMAYFGLKGSPSSTR